MKIGVDIDDVLVDFGREIIKSFNEKYKKNILYKDIKSYLFWNDFGISKGEVFSLIHNFSKCDKFLDPDLIEGSKDVIRQLNKKHDLFCVTHRPKIVKERTLIFLKKHFP